MSFFKEALANAGEVSNNLNSAIANLFPLLAIVVVFYFLVLKPQQKKIKEHSKMLDNLIEGDKVLTGGGIIATIKKVSPKILDVDLGSDLVVQVTKETVLKKIED